jgi:murein DD-endopeptidase MepM/ murein hydrolase activator NlpD
MSVAGSARAASPSVPLAAAGLLLLFGAGTACTGAARPRIPATEVPSPAARQAPRPSPEPGPVESPPHRAAPRAERPTFDWPVAGGRLLAGFGAPRGRQTHQGIDIGAPSGRVVVAARPGVVVYSGTTMRGYGKTVILEHQDHLRSLYAHNSELLVEHGAWVERGQPIARVGRTGNATVDHCHFEIRLRNVPVDPIGFLHASQASR